MLTSSPLTRAVAVLLQSLLAMTTLVPIYSASAFSTASVTDSFQDAVKEVGGIITSITSKSESSDVTLLPANFESSLTQMLFPRGVTPGIAAQLFSVGEWILTVLSGIIFLQLLRLMMVARILHLPRTLRQTIVTAQRITEGMAGGIGSFARLIYEILADCGHKGGDRSRVTAVAPLAAYLLLIGGIILINISQVSLKNVLLTVEKSGTVSLPTAGWLLNGSLADSTIAEKQKTLLVSIAETTGGGYAVTDVRRLWAALNPNGYNADFGLYVKDGVICLRPTKGLPPQKDVQFESIAYCEGFTASCSALQGMKVKVMPGTDRIQLIGANRPPYITDDELWSSTITNISFPGTTSDFFAWYGVSTDGNPQGIGIREVPETISGLVVSSWTLSLSEEEIKTVMGGKKILDNVLDRSAESITLKGETLLPGGGFAYRRLALDGGKSPVYGMWAGQCDLKLRRGHMAPDKPNNELPVVRNWTLRNSELLDKNLVLGVSSSLPTESLRDSDGEGRSLSALRVAVTADSSQGKNLVGLNGKVTAERVLARGVSSWLFALSSGQPGQDIDTTAKWEVREPRLLANMLWATVGLGLYVLLACVTLVLWLYARFGRYGGNMVELSYARQMTENCTSVWGLVRGIVLLAPASPLHDTTEGEPKTELRQRRDGGWEEERGNREDCDRPPLRPVQEGMMALDSEKAVLREAKDWDCQPVVLTCEDKYESRQVAAIKLQRRYPFQH